MTRRTRSTALIAFAACAALAALSFGSSASARSTATPVRGGDLVIARTTDSTTMDPTRSLRQRGDLGLPAALRDALRRHARRQGREAVAGHELRPVEGQAHVHVPPAQGRQVPHRPGDDGRRRQVLDRRRAQPQDGLGLHRHRDQERDRQGQVHGRHQDEVPVGADGRRHRALHNAIIPKNYGGKTKKAFFDAPVGTGPFKWDHWTQGQGDQVRQATTSTGRRASRTWTA